MPRKAKDKVIEDLTKKETLEIVSKKEPVKKIVQKKVSEKKQASKKTAIQKTNEKEKSSKTITSRKNNEKKETSKKAEVKKINEKKETNKKTTKKEAFEKEMTEATSKKNATKKANVTKTNSVTKKVSTKKSSSSTKSSTTKAVTKKSPTSKTKKTRTTKSTNSMLSFLGEYYDLPNQYEKTMVKILAQTPTILFVYWDISTLDRQNFITLYGEAFFQETTPFLLVINKTKNYQFEIEVNDYANSWYLHIPDSDCKYEVILMRKNKNSQIILENNGRMTVTSSNNLETPNDHILFEKLGKTVFFKDVKTELVQEKTLSSFAFICNIGRIYNIYDFYKEIYQNELNGDELGTSLSSSNFSSNLK